LSSVYGNNIKVTIFGQSHSAAVGLVIDGLPAGEKVNTEALQAFLDRRAPGRNDYSSARSERDEPEFLSGLINGATCGAPICVVLRNQDARRQDYDDLAGIPRPGHADYTAYIKHHGHNDASGGGHLSGRLTAPLCLAGGICLQLLERKGIDIAAHISELGGVADIPFDPVGICGEQLRALRLAGFPVLSADSGVKMVDEIGAVRGEGDSIGGIIECAAAGIPAGLGDPMFDGVENCIARIVFAIPGVRAIEFGAGFAAAGQRGSANNDTFYMDDDKVRTRTNNHGGVLGGITSGMPLIFRAAIKPTPSIARRQDSVRLIDMFEPAHKTGGEDIKLVINGRHDPCIVPRAVPCIEAAAAIAILDMMKP